MSLLRQSKSISTLIFIITFLFIGNVSAQTEIFGFVGYMMTTSVPVQKGDLQVDDGLNYGLGIDVAVKRGTQVELLWISEQTHVRLKNFRTGLTEDLFDMSVHYFQIGAVQEMGRGKVRPFGAFTVGATLFSPNDPNRGDEWLASITFGGGAKIDMSDKVGIRLQGRILVPLIFSGGGLWVGTGGVGVGVGSWTPFVQFDLTAGIYIKLGGRSRPKSF